MLKKRFKNISLLLIGVILLATGCASQQNNLSIQEESLQEQEPENKTITISAVGDIMVHGAQLKAQVLNDGTFDFENNFKYIKNIIKQTDISIANLETTININKKPSGYPSFNSPKELLSALKNTGFDIISTINNHSLDTGYSGVLSTLNEIKVEGLKPVGTKSSAEEKNYLIEDINDIKIGLSAFSYGEIIRNEKYLNGIKSGNANDLLNVVDSVDVEKAFNTIKKEIDLMKAEGAEFLIISMHWGEEYKQTPTDYQKQLAQKLANEGVNLILGSHPHVVQPIEFLKSEVSDEECLVVYSMGNIISNQREEEMGFNESENGVIPLISVEKTIDESVKIKEVEYIPTWVNKELKNEKVIYEIIPINKDISQLAREYNISEEDLKISFNNTTALMKDERVKLHNKKDA